MRLAVALCFALVSLCSRANDVAILHVAGGERQALQRALVELAQQRLESDGLVLDREHAWLTISSALPASGDVEARPTWSMKAGIPSLPLTFELRPRGSSEPSTPAVATLAVKLQRRVLVAGRRLRKGSQVSCGDFALELRNLEELRRDSLPVACDQRLQASALRDLAQGEMLRAEDIGQLPDVLMGAPVQLSASEGGITVTALATALADARVGDALDVRLQRPARTLRARVTARGAAQLLDETP